MSPPVTDRRESLGAVRTSTDRWTSLIRSVEDPTRNALGVWNIRDVAVHTSHIYRTFPTLMKGGSSPVQELRVMAEEWQRLAAEDPEHDMDAIATRIDEAAEEFVSLSTEEEWSVPKNWHGGVKAPTYTLASILTNESMLHGLDVAKVVGRPWELPPSWARLAIEGLYPVLHNFLDRDQAAGLDAVFELRLRGGRRTYVQVSDGALNIDEVAPGKVDCIISADPVAYLLIGYKRQSRLKPILTGKVVSWGRKPWLSLRFSKLFHSV